LVVDPIAEYLTAVTRKILGLPSPMIDRARDGESVLVINTNGDAYQVADAYEPDLAMGNVATTPIAEILTSEAMLRSRRRDADRIRSMCGPCSYAGYCSGAPAFESPREGTDEGRCQIHHRVHQFIERYLRDAGLDAPALRRLIEVRA
jgi:radical SAM protein with 4Fe4S-binding SPASM domain